MSSLTPELAEIERQIAAVKADAAELVNGLKESQFNWRPDQFSWSMAECYLHLNMIGERYVRCLEKAVTAARAAGLTGNGPYTQGKLGQWILSTTEPPVKRKYKAARSFVPAYGQPITAVLPTFLHLQGQLALMLEQANGLDLARVKVPAPGMGPMKFNLLLTFAWIAAHERRHLWQARQVREHAAFV